MQINIPETKEGETYGGVIINPDGTGHHFILLPGAQDNTRWKDAMAWAKEQGGDLPNRVEQALLLDKNKDQFEERYYWSNTQRASHSVFAWFQDFHLGYQLYWSKLFQLRARAVRRVPF